MLYQFSSDSCWNWTQMVIITLYELSVTQRNKRNNHNHCNRQICGMYGMYMD